MIRWPWVSRLAYDTAIDERDRLRAQNDTLTDQLVRLARREKGMREVGPTGRKPKRPDLPSEVDELLEAIDNPSFRQMGRSRAIQLIREGKKRQEVVDLLKKELEP